MIVEGDHQRAWQEDEKRETRMVFIGRNLDEEKIIRTFQRLYRGLEYANCRVV